MMHPVLLLFPPLLVLTAAILDLSVTTATILPFGRVTSSCIRSIVMTENDDLQMGET